MYLVQFVPQYLSRYLRPLYAETCHSPDLGLVSALSRGPAYLDTVCLDEKSGLGKRQTAVCT